MDGGRRYAREQTERERLENAESIWESIASMGMLIAIVCVGLILIYLIMWAFGSDWAEKQLKSYSGVYKGLISGVIITLIGLMFSSTANRNKHFARK